MALCTSLDKRLLLIKKISLIITLFFLPIMSAFGSTTTFHANRSYVMYTFKAESAKIYMKGKMYILRLNDIHPKTLYFSLHNNQCGYVNTQDLLSDWHRLGVKSLQKLIKYNSYHNNILLEIGKKKIPMIGIPLSRGIETSATGKNIKNQRSFLIYPGKNIKIGTYKNQGGKLQLITDTLPLLPKSMPSNELVACGSYKIEKEY